MPERVFAQVSPRSIGGLSLFDAGESITSAEVVNFVSEAAVIQAAAASLETAGFEVLQVSPITINVAGPPSLYEQFFGTTLRTVEREVQKSGNREEMATFIEADDDRPGFVSAAASPASNAIEGVAIERPRYLAVENAIAPTRGYWHLDVPNGVSTALNAGPAHRSGVTGAGIRLVMTDTGWYRHPYFVARGYRSSPVVLGPGATSPTTDEVGHGTAESANAFAVAPDIDFTMVKMAVTATGGLINTTGAFNAAVGLAPHIISSSWTGDVASGPLAPADTALAAAVALAVAEGIVVLFSAGNGHFGWPAQHPDVLAAGGVFMDPAGALQASDYASGFTSSVYPGRVVPDVSGLCGMRPRAAYIMLPLPASCSLDTSGAGGTHPNGDETPGDDGWAAISGTSASCPQLAGLAALMLQACPRLSPASIRSIMQRTARDVTAGGSNPRTGGTAGSGPDNATGWGLVDANRAVLSAKLRCLVIKPPIPVEPILRQPIAREPIVREPILRQPVIREPISREPIIREPIIRQPIEPIDPLRPGPAEQSGPAGGAAGEAGAAAGMPLTAEDVARIEDWIKEGGTNLEL